jgi:hypothetical protein
MPFVDVTAITMLRDLAETLHERGVRLVVARDIGVVRDVVERTEGGAEVQIYPTVQAAVESAAPR